MKLATTSLSSPCLIRSLGWTPCGRINILRNLNKPRLKATMVEILRELSRDEGPACQALNTFSPGWCGEVKDVKYSDNDRVTVVYRVTIHGSDGQAYREAIGTLALNDERSKDPEAEAEEKAFAKACARFGYNEKKY